MSDLLITGASLLGGESTDVLVRDGVIAAVGAEATAGESTQRIDADGLALLPGLVDLHTHLREPGREDAETVRTGSAAAAAGGFTAVLAMANTSPVTDTAEAAERVLDLGVAAGHCACAASATMRIRLEPPTRITLAICPAGTWAKDSVSEMADDRSSRQPCSAACSEAGS